MAASLLPEAVPAPVPAEPSTCRERPRAGRADLAVLAGEIVLVALAAVVGAVLNQRHVPIYASAAPLMARWLPHVGPGSAIAVAVAATIVWCGPATARTVSWRTVLAAAYAAATAWTVALALVDGWTRGITRRLSTPDEYLHDVPRVHGVSGLLADFSGHILSTDPQPWTTHVSGHPPGALLVFVALDRVGLGNGTAAGILCILAGAAAPVCVAVTLRALGSEDAARAALPFLVLFPGAVWVGVSADGLFVAVAAAGLALIAVTGWWWNLAGGVVLGYTLYLSYGLVFMGVFAAAVLFLKPAGRGRALTVAVIGVLAVVTGFTAGGFWWPTGYHLVVERYYSGYGGVRPYRYWVWANLACLVISAGPAAGPALWRALSRLPRIAPTVLSAVALLAIVAADLTGLSKAETERIWLPYSMWLLAATALLPVAHRRRWLALQAVTALIVNHLLLTHW